jgi:glycosyltransferase involved in cell wall biosynthesis
VYDTNDYPLISVVIPSFNQGQYIEETLLSVIGQQYPNLEILVMDGGSTDNTIEIIKKYSKYISYWQSQKDTGQADAINQGMRKSSGEILCWLNSDDMYLPGTLLDIGKRFSGLTEEKYLIYGSAVTINESNETLAGGAQIAGFFDEFSLTYTDFIIQPSSFWTRKLWQQVGELNTSYHYVLDWDWFIRAAKVAKFEHVPKFYSVYRYHPFHKTSKGGSERRKEINEIVKTYSSDYWADIYTEVQNIYPEVIDRRDLLISLRVPKGIRLLPILFPRLKRKLKDYQHLYTVLNMYR